MSSVRERTLGSFRYASSAAPARYLRVRTFSGPAPGTWPRLRLRIPVRRGGQPAGGPGGVAAPELGRGQVGAAEVAVVRHPRLDVGVRLGHGPQVPEPAAGQDGAGRRLVG